MNIREIYQLLASELGKQWGKSFKCNLIGTNLLSIWGTEAQSKGRSIQHLLDSNESFAKVSLNVLFYFISVLSTCVYVFYLCVVLPEARRGCWIP